MSLLRSNRAGLLMLAAFVGLELLEAHGRRHYLRGLHHGATLRRMTVKEG